MTFTKGNLTIEIKSITANHVIVEINNKAILARLENNNLIFSFNEEINGKSINGISLDDEKVLEYIKDEMNKEEIEATRDQLISNLNNEKNLTKNLTFKRIKAAYPSK